MIILESVAIIFTLACVYFTIKNKVIAWPLGIIGVGAYLWLFVNVGLYAEVITQIVFLGQSFYGWYNWAKLKNKPPAPITRLIEKFKNTTKNFMTKNDETAMVYHITTIVLVLSVVIYNVIMGLYQGGFINTPSVPIIDSFTTSLSLVANFYLAKRYIENWYLWMIVDVVYVGMFLYKELYFTAGLYLLFFFMARKGYLTWKKLINTA